nr:CoA transferase [Oscillospiraceae bacterium]
MERALSGIRVIQLANFVAAPAATRYLADRGADVIIIGGVKREPLRYSAVQEGRPQDQLENTTWEYLNGGKRCIALNLKDPAGKEAFMRLLDTADVLVT